MTEEKKDSPFGLLKAMYGYTLVFVPLAGVYALVNDARFADSWKEFPYLIVIMLLLLAWTGRKGHFWLNMGAGFLGIVFGLLTWALPLALLGR